MRTKQRTAKDQALIFEKRSKLVPAWHTHRMPPSPRAGRLFDLMVASLSFLGISNGKASLLLNECQPSRANNPDGCRRACW